MLNTKKYNVVAKQQYFNFKLKRKIAYPWKNR